MPNARITLVLDEPIRELLVPLQHALKGKDLGVAVAGESLTLVDSSAYLHDEATILDASELGEAERALIEDGIFRRADWMDSYLAQGWDRDVLLRTAVKYGWALAHLEVVCGSDGAQQHSRIAWSVADGFETTTSAEFRFLGAEIIRRSPQVGWISPCTPARFESGVDYAGDPNTFGRWLSSLEATDCIGLMFPDSAEKFGVLRLITARKHNVALGLRKLGWTGGLRVVARHEPPLFREMLVVAQERFAFDKGSHALNTTESDIQSLPQVPDTELETTFLDDFRGRQLLHVTADSVLADEARAERLTEVFTTHHEELGTLVAASVDTHLAAMGAA
jgi:hypothetical protein